MEEVLKLFKKHGFNGVILDETGIKGENIRGGGEPTPRWKLIKEETMEKKPVTEPLDVKKLRFGPKQLEAWKQIIFPACQECVKTNCFLIIVHGPEGMRIFKHDDCRFGEVAQYYALLPSPAPPKKKRNKKRQMEINENPETGNTEIRNVSKKMKKCIEAKGWSNEMLSDGTTVLLKGVSGVSNEIFAWQKTIEKGKIPTIVVVLSSPPSHEMEAVTTTINTQEI
jgi:hypothetical protein